MILAVLLPDLRLSRIQNQSPMPSPSESSREGVQGKRFIGQRYAGSARLWLSPGYATDPEEEAMDKQSLGGLRFEASELGLGFVGISEVYETTDESDVLDTIHRPPDLGCTTQTSLEVRCDV